MECIRDALRPLRERHGGEVVTFAGEAGGKVEAAFQLSSERRNVGLGAVGA
jgi:hypothetical protein